jgi:hypothetical protein
MSPYSWTKTISAAVVKRPPLFRLSLEGGLDWSPTARVQRGSSETARCTSKGDHLDRPLIHLPSSLVTSSGMGAACSSTARVQGMPVHLVYFVYLVCLVDRIENSFRRTSQTRKTGQPDRRARARCASTEDHQPPSSSYFLKIILGSVIFPIETVTSSHPPAPNSFSTVCIC